MSQKLDALAALVTTLDDNLKKLDAQQAADIAAAAGTEAMSAEDEAQLDGVIVQVSTLNDAVVARLTSAS